MDRSISRGDGVSSGRQNVEHQNGEVWVTRDGKGLYRVWRQSSSSTHGVRCGTFHFHDDPPKALRMAVEHCDVLAARIAKAG